ncbi:MAG: hypothetical protein VZQ47_00730 [Treponema sp.]|nr:hypothetical protein [Treponema sp.]MEE3434067.1 hypothetical protein [Treponema sp.]
MKKKLLVLLALAVGLALSTECFAQKYRYAVIQEADNRILIADFANPIPDENLTESIRPLNTKKERFAAESGFNNISSFYYSGQLSLVYVDYSKDPDDPDMSYIDSWGEFMSYVRGTK